MKQWQQQGEITAFDPLQHSAEALAAQGLVAVATGRPTNEVFPGMQTTVWVDVRNVIRPDDVGATIGAPHLYTAAGRLLQQFAYKAGLPPGHAGLHFKHGNTNDVEVLASPDVRATLTEHAQNGAFVGYLCLADQASLESHTSPDTGGYPKTRRTLPSRGLVGLTVANINVLVGAGGIDALRDPADHPDVSIKQRATGIRSERLG